MDLGAPQPVAELGAQPVDEHGQLVVGVVAHGGGLVLDHEPVAATDRVAVVGDPRDQVGAAPVVEGVGEAVEAVVVLGGDPRAVAVAGSACRTGRAASRGTPRGCRSAGPRSHGRLPRRTCRARCRASAGAARRPRRRPTAGPGTSPGSRSGRRSGRPPRRRPAGAAGRPARPARCRCSRAGSSAGPPGASPAGRAPGRRSVRRSAAARAPRRRRSRAPRRSPGPPR